MGDKIKVENKLSQFRPAAKNANKHTPRGLKLLADSMAQVGYVTPITVAADGEALDGSARLETAFDKFGDEAIVIRHDGTKPIVMVREDIPNADTPEAKWIAYGANRVAELSLEWDAETIINDLDNGFDLSDLFGDNELAEFQEQLDAAGELGQDIGSVDRNLGNRKKQIKPVLYSDQIATFEAAILATGQTNRAQALIEICEFYIAKGQSHF